MASSDSEPPGITAESTQLVLWIRKGKAYKDVPDFVSEELCRRLTLPEDALAVLPAQKLSISQLIESRFSMQVQMLQIGTPSSCFSEREPNTSLTSLLLRPVPSRKFIQQLQACSGQAMLDGKVSVKDWTQKDVYVPFSVLTWWNYLHDAISAKQAWLRAKEWLKKLNLKGDRNQEILKRVNLVLAKVAWHGSFRGGLKSFVSATDMALFLSREMLTTSQIYAMLLVLEARCQKNPLFDSIIIAPPVFGDALSAIPSYEPKSPYPNGSPKCIQDISSQLMTRPATLWTVAYSHPLHFAALRIDNTLPSVLKVNWGDSISRKPPSSLIKGIKVWAEHHFPQKRIVFEQNLDCASQTDSYSCGIISVNTLKHHIFGKSFWSQKSRELLRITEFLDIMEFSLALEVPTVVPLLADPPTVTPNPRAAPSLDEAITKSNANNTSSRPSKKRKGQEDITTLEPPTKQRRTTSHSADKISSTSKGPLQKAPPSTQKKAHFSGLSRSAIAKRIINESVEDGTFKRSAVKWDTWKEKLKEIDTAFEVNEDDPKSARLVRHSKCATWIQQATPYDVTIFKAHAERCKGKKCKEAESNTHTLQSMFFPSDSKPHRSKSLKLWPCPGLSTKNDTRIGTYLKRTTVESAGGVSEHSIAKELFNVEKVSELSKSQREVVDLKQQQTHRWRLDHFHHRIFAIGLDTCMETVSSSDSLGDTEINLLKPCESCQKLLKLRAFLNAINKDIPDDANLAHVPRRFQNSAAGEQIMKCRGLHNLFSETSDSEMSTDIFRRFARQFAEGKFDDQPVFLGLISVMVEQQDRKDHGRGLQNMKYPPAFNDWCHELLCIRPEAYRTFQSTFGGRTERSFLQIRSTKPAFVQGIGEQTLERANQYIKDYGYSQEGPVVTGVDDTKLLAAFRPYYDKQAKKWFVTGGTGEPMEVADIAQLEAQLADAKVSKAVKLRLWSLGIPLPNIPPLILAASPIGSKNNAKELAEMEANVLKLLIDSPTNFNITSLGSDGTTVEREARRELVRSGVATTVIYRIPHPEGGGRAILVELLKIRNRVMAVIQDTKHCRKTIRNNLFAGPRSLVLGQFLICYQQVREIAFDKEYSPLYERDVVKLDRQDDRAAARLFSAKTLEYLVERNSENLGLITFLFVFGELVDAYQSRTTSHAERVKQVLRAKFFKDMWKGFLKEAGYSLARHFLSREADDIIDIVVNGLLGLVYVHRDYLLSCFPLLLWANGTESNEHIFGFLRSIIPDFTMLDVLRLVPKLAVRLMAACKRKGKAADFRKTASGYSHTYSEADGADLNFLAIFPTDDEIELLAKTAYDEATTLWGLLGYCPSGDLPTSNVSETNDDENLSDDEDDDQEDDNISDRRQLQNALDAAAVLQSEGLPSDQGDRALDQCGFAAASLNLSDLERIESLPDSDPDALEEIRQALSNALIAISAQGPEAHAIVQGLLTSVAAPLPEATPSAAAADPMSSVTQTDLSQLVLMRTANQSRESAESVRNPRGKKPETEEESANKTSSSRNKAKPPSERQMLAKKIYEVLKQDTERGISTGANRQRRWEQIAAGSTSANNDATGNTANAQAAARTGAAAVITRRRTQFAKTRLAEDLATAKVDLLSKLCLMIGKVLTMYERGGGKAAKHGWVSEASSVGSVSYLPSQIWAQNRGRNFKAHWGSTSHMRLPRFAHLPAAAFLYFIPSSAIRLINDAFLELNAKFYDDVFTNLTSQKPLIVVAVKNLLKTRRKKGDAANNDDI
ncbi:hypothetical protein GALMADRAFT_206799 [Galerina marginata CBS 339.88]|uniref:Ubiquitin-like protease family profile domain-containing protein n=1 Tax=Galerina marginata (strain CBS 339.88) TaxID=685588 RepID=A0A067TTB5_GALM3|nr:hypothetical protein GALMADRAFT_206799 [Galerina marginata CBS 339.88]